MVEKQCCHLRIFALSCNAHACGIVGLADMDVSTSFKQNPRDANVLANYGGVKWGPFVLVAGVDVGQHVLVLEKECDQFFIAA